MQIRDPGSGQSYFIRAHLCTNFEVTPDPEFARNQKIVLINVDQDAILYLRVNYQHVLKKFPNPNMRIRIPNLLLYVSWHQVY